MSVGTLPLEMGHVINASIAEIRLGVANYIKLLKNLKLFTAVLVGFLGFYIFEFYIQANNANINFWCVQTLNNFNFGPIKNVSLPIHCDEGPYRIASNSIEEFFSPSNPYQTRPLLVLILSFLRRFFESISILNISDYQIFRISIFIIQVVILFSIISIFSNLMKLKFQSYSDYLIILVVIGIPGIRWNILFPSAGNVTLILFLLSIKFLSEKKTYSKNNKSIYLLFSFLSVAHLSSIIYGFILQLATIFKIKKIRIFTIVSNLFILILVPLLYRIFIFFSKYEFYDWHTSTYRQFSWLYIEYQKGYSSLLNATKIHLSAYWDEATNFVGYFSILCFYYLSLIAIAKFKKYPVPAKIRLALFINLFIFIFWAFQGITESFRFTNYSIGYFLFISVVILLIETFKKDPYLLFSIFAYVLSIGYLEPYNSSLNFHQWNVFSILSLILFFIFTIRETVSFKGKV